jgi:hypothetical protein
LVPIMFMDNRDIANIMGKSYEFEQLSIYAIHLNITCGRRSATRTINPILRRGKALRFVLRVIFARLAEGKADDA